MGISKLMKGTAVALALASAMLGAAPAQAGLMSVTVWQGTNAGGNINDPLEQALPTNALASTTAIANFFYNGSLQWDQQTQALNTLRDFVSSGGGSVSGCVGSACNGATALNAVTLSTAPFAITTLFRITFTIPAAVSNVAIRHDDGVSIWNSTNTVSYLNSALPTAAINNTFSLPSAGTYNIWFVQANGAPTVLKTTVADLSNVPEPGTLTLFAAAALSLLGFAFMRRKSTV